MDPISVLLGTSFTSGFRLYATILGLGLAQRFASIPDLPGNLHLLAEYPVLIVAGILCFLEFVSDKIPIVDSGLDSVNSFIRPLGGGILAFMAMSDATNPAIPIAAGLLGGGVTLTTHGVKATGRVAINTSPEPVSNVVTSTVEDGLVLGGLWLIITNPVVMAVLVVLFLIFAVWFFRKASKFIKSASTFFKRKSVRERT